jgi:PrtD family type I secretion system ABC transporter
MTNNTASASVFGWLKSLAGVLPRTALWLLFYSLAVNLLLLVAPLYMLQVYDSVLTSGSYDTLIWLTVIALFLLAIYGAAEAGRRRLAAIAGQMLEADYSARAFERFGLHHDEAGALPRDLANSAKLAGPFASGTILAFVDLPFVPLFMIALLMVHPLLGLLGLAGGAIVFALAVIAELANRTPSENANAVQMQAARFAEGLARQRSALVAMGLVERASAAWQSMRASGDAAATEASRKESLFTAVSRASRQMLQIVILCAGAALALSQQLSPGSIVAASIVLSRALAPIDLIVGSWRSIVQARSAFSEACERLGTLPEHDNPTALPPPLAVLKLDRVSASLPGSEVPLIRPFSVELSGGTLIALKGANGSGKTTLLQTISGAWPIQGGKVSLGGRSIHDWPPQDRGRHIGYLPQGVELLPATIAQNISRLGDATSAQIVEAAIDAGAHELILGLPDGYESLIGPGGIHLSAGQRQSIGLARALFGAPVLLLLDEPTSNLDDAAAERAIRAIASRLSQGALALVATHDPRLLALASQVFELADGSVTARRIDRAGPAKSPSLHKGERP